jgi:hypothetical protein
MMRKAILIIILLLAAFPAAAQTPLGVGLHEAENNVNISYTGTWTTLVNGANTYVISTAQGSTMSFQFDGKAILIYRNQLATLNSLSNSLNSTGSITYSAIGDISGVEYRIALKVIFPYEIEVSSFSFTLGDNVGTPSGGISWEIRASNTGGTAPSFSLLSGGPLSVTPATTRTVNLSAPYVFEKNTPYWLVLYTQNQANGSRYTWRSGIDELSSVALRSSDGGNTWASFTTSVKSASFSGRLAPDVEMCLDSICSTISNFSLTDFFRVPVGFVAPESGVHTFTITQAQSKGWFQVDNILVLPDQTQAGNTVIPIDIQLEVTQEPEADLVTWNITDSEANTQAVSFEYSMSAGEVMVAILLTGLLILTAARLGVSLIQWKR